MQLKIGNTNATEGAEDCEIYGGEYPDVDIDLQNNRMTSDSIQPFVDLFEQNLKIRTLNLRHNVITDEGAQLLAQALVNNEYITKLLCDMNPIRHSILEDIEHHTKQNQ